MNETTNILMDYTLGDLKQRADINFWLALVCLAVCAINLVLLILNATLHHQKHLKTGNDTTKLTVSHRTFHMLEFWTSHIYAITEAVALVTSPKTMLTIYSKPNILKLLLFFNVVNSLVPTLLITLDTNYFETLAHNLEYVNECTLSFITLVLLSSLLKLPDDNEGDEEDDLPTNINHNNPRENAVSNFIAGVIAIGVGLLNLALYNYSGNEHMAHYVEFTFNLVTALVTFWFCMDNRFVAQMEIGQILYGQHQNCSFCHTKSNDFYYQKTLVGNKRWKQLYGSGNTIDANNDIGRDDKNEKEYDNNKYINMGPGGCNDDQEQEEQNELPIISERTSLLSLRREEEEEIV